VRRWALPIAVAALLALAALVLVELLRPTATPTQAEQAQQVGGDLRCPDCQALSVAESQTAAAAAIRRQIAEQLAAGRTPGQIRSYFVARYGEWILLAPTSPFAWWIPAAAVLLGVGALACWWRRGKATLAPLTPPVPGRGVREQIREEVEQVDA
jgi:cytochrome c-type biogenesis protein CcmH